jgi:ER membrane protein SH3
MRVVAGAGLGFLLAVLWFDLMFDVQALGRHEPELPSGVRDSIAAYYRRVTTTARPMNRLVAAAMLVALVGLVGQIVRGDANVWVEVVSLALTAFAIGLAAVRTVRNAVRLGGQTDPAGRQSVLARSILRDHVLCFVAIACTLILQVAAAR